VRGQVSEGLVRLYERASNGGLLDRPLARRAYESAYLAYKRLIEAGPIDGLRGLVATGSTAIDVGANIGFFSVRLARWVGPAGQVIAVEPEARNVDSLRRRVARTGLSDVVTCVQAAAADRAGERRLAVNPGHPGDHHLSSEGEPVVAITLDDLVANDPRRVTLIKIDVQGAESMVLAGAHNVIKTQRPALFIEVDGPSLARFGSSERELIDTLVRLGYRGYRLTRHGIGASEEPGELVRRSSAGYIDVLFLPVRPDAPTPENNVGEHRQ
jgi:FkbM family methyltransferase